MHQRLLNGLAPSSSLKSVLATALHLGLDRVDLSDNGIVSLNLPISGQVGGGLASRSAHPKCIFLFNQLSGDISDKPVAVANSLRTRTRRGPLEILHEFGFAH
jgi:hypothetical protein